jgi:4-amino-4-deoxy-L-arabinose transferase-like glycosyltransferase
MTKGNGFALALAPPFAIILCRRWDLLKQRSLYGLVVVVAVVCLPWHFLTRVFLIPTMQ